MSRHAYPDDAKDRPVEGVVFAALDFLCRIAKRNRFAFVRIGKKSSIVLWRVKPRQANSFSVGDSSIVRRIFVFEKEEACIGIGRSCY